MKRILQTISAAKLAVIVLAAATIALILLVGRIMWHDVASPPSPNSPSQKPSVEAVYSDPRISLLKPHVEFSRKFRQF